MEPVPSKARGNSRPWRSRARKWPLCVSPHTRVTPLPHCLLSLRLEEKEVARTAGKSSGSRSDVFFFPATGRERGGRGNSLLETSRYFNVPRANIFARAKRFRNTKGTPTPVNTCHASFVFLRFLFFFFPHRLFFLCSTRAQRSLRHHGVLNCFWGQNMGEGSGGKWRSVFCRINCFFVFFFFPPKLKLTRSFNDIRFVVANASFPFTEN